MPGLSSFSDPKLCHGLFARLRGAVERLGRPLRFMEVCGTHTVALFRSGVRSLLPESLRLLSGPGCPVCVTHESEVAAMLGMSEQKDIVLATFGDIMRVPGPGGKSLKQARAAGAAVEIVYSPAECLALAGRRPGKLVVFLGVGFETTAPAVAGTILMARQRDLDNFCVASFHKLVPPALEALLAEESEHSIDGFFLPGHVSTILGIAPYQAIAEKRRVPSVIAGFEPADLLNALIILVEQQSGALPRVINAYRRAVDDQGNPRARAILDQVFIRVDAKWRGLGPIPRSGLAIAPAFERFDAFKRLNVSLPETPATPGCKCGDVLKGRIAPGACPLYAKACTPATPVGPCMVSAEGSCAAYFAYTLEE